MNTFQKRFENEIKRFKSFSFGSTIPWKIRFDFLIFIAVLEQMLLVLLAQAKT